MSEYSQDFVTLVNRLEEDQEARGNFIKDKESFLSQFNLSQDEIKLLEVYQTAEALDAGMDELVKSISSAPPEVKVGDEQLMRKVPSSGMGFWVALTYFLMVIVYWALSLFFPASLQTISFPLWGEINVVIRWIIMIYWFIAGFSVVMGIRDKFTKSKRPTRVSLWIITVVVVIIPGFIILISLPTATQVLIAQVILILVFTALPASLYPLFITSKGRTLWEEFKHNLSYLDPVGYKDQEKIYSKKFIALYGQISREGITQRILTGEATFPVLLNTLIIGFGWLLFFQATDRNSTITTGVITPFTFGFLGAYMFSLQMLFRRYVQSDLKTTAYTHASQRILITWVWAFVLTILPWEIIRLDTSYQNQIISVLAFVVGIFPDIAWQVIGRFVKMTLGLAIPSFRQEHPLNEINGITVWVEARLLEENIENIQNLVTANIPDLMLRTNLDPNRIIDWIDQGILRLHLPQKAADDRMNLKDAFKQRGIIKATDLYFSHLAFRGRDSNRDKIYISKELDPKIQTMIDAFEDDTNMYHIRAWREVYDRQTKSLTSAINDLLPETTDVEEEPDKSAAGKNSSELAQDTGSSAE